MLPEQSHTENNQGERSSSLGLVAQAISRVVAPSLMPSAEYSSVTGLYGGQLHDINGEKVFVTKGLTGTIDRVGDRVLRRFDFEKLEGIGNLILNLRTPPLRRRGSVEEIASNIKRLGLEDVYAPHPRGVRIVDPSLFTEGITLYDIFHSEQIGNPHLASINKDQALEVATRYIKEVHDVYGPTGDSAEDLIFRTFKNEEVSEPVLNIPDVVYTPNSKLSDQEKKAVEIVEFMARIAVFVGDKGVSQAMALIAQTYNDPEVLRLSSGFLREGKLPLSGDESALTSPIDERVINISPSFFTRHPRLRAIATIHNNRLGIKKEEAIKIKTQIVTACEIAY